MRRLALLSACLLTVPSQALAALCAPMEVVKKSLAESSDEHPVQAGTMGDNVMVLFLSPARTYTLVVLREDGLACLMAAGDEWHPLTPGKQGMLSP